MKHSDSGSYQLTVELTEFARIRVGALGERDFPAGTYVYTGSAMRNLEARVARHLRPHDKKFRWHIDYLLASPVATVVEVLKFPASVREECARNLGLIEAGAEIPVPGFGSSDCRACPSHLVKVSPGGPGTLVRQRPARRRLRRPSS